MKTIRSIHLLLLLCVSNAFLFNGCGKKPIDASEVEANLDSDPTKELPSKYKSFEEVPKRDFSEATKAPAFQNAIQEASLLLGAKPKLFNPMTEESDVKGGIAFDVPSEKGEKILLKAHTDFLQKGFYLFRYDQSFGIGGKPDQFALLPTSDKYEVIAAMETNGANWEIGTAGIIAWLKDLEKEQPFVLTGIGGDYMEGAFTGPVKNPKELAKRFYAFCPDIVDQGVGDVGKLAEELKNGKLYLWWD